VQVPLWQVKALQVQDAAGASSSHGPENAHALQVIVLAEHVSPFVLRVQPTVHAALVGMQTSFWHANVVHVQLCVPLLSQVSENPLHALQAVSVAVSQVTPLVLRMQAAVSSRGEATQAPARHVWSVHDRVWVPEPSHVELKLPQAPNGPHDVPAPHMLFSFLGVATQAPVPRLQTPRLHSSFIDEQSTAPNWHVCDVRLHVPAVEHRSGGVWQS
jgi:hypothetical protein